MGVYSEHSTRMCKLVVLALFSLLSGGFAENVSNRTEVDEGRGAKALSIFNVVTFPNSACGATNGYNGTCYTAAECSSLGGTASGTCASSFGVCCVFSISCGSSSSANNTYAIISSYSTSTDSDPCQYTFCKTNSDVCKLRIDFDTMVLAGPQEMSTTISADDGARVGDCTYDTLTVSNPGGKSPPTICGYNTGQHMWVPASDQCNTINIDIDTSSTSVSSSQYHLSSQFYDICIRRARSYCSVCFSPYVHSSTTGTATSYGVGGSSLGPAQTGALATYCTGITTQPAAAGFGDYLEIANLQPSIGSSGTVNTKSRICGAFWNAGDNPQTSHATACSFAIPFKVGVHFDDDESIKASPIASPDLNKAENDPAATNGAGYGYSGFWLRYWQNSR